MQTAHLTLPYLTGPRRIPTEECNLQGTFEHSRCMMHIQGPRLRSLSQVRAVEKSVKKASATAPLQPPARHKRKGESAPQPITAAAETKVQEKDADHRYPWRARLLRVSVPSTPCPRPPLPAFLSQHTGPGLPLSAAPTLPLAWRRTGYYFCGILGVLWLLWLLCLGCSL
jgi:hypothetical protein